MNCNKGDYCSFMLNTHCFFLFIQKLMTVNRHPASTEFVTKKRLDMLATARMDILGLTVKVLAISHYTCKSGCMELKIQFLCF